MAIGRATLSILHFPRLIYRDGIGQSQLVIHYVFPVRGRALNMAASIGVTGQSAIGIALYQGPMDTFLDPTHYLP